MLSTTDANGNETDFAYDSLGHRTSISDALSQVATMAYSGTTGLMSSMTDVMSRTTSLAYDNQRRVTSTTTVLGTTSLAYDSTTGEIYTITDPQSHVTTLAHDGLGRVTHIATPDSHNQTWVFGTSGLQTSFTDKAGTVEATTYDAYGRGLVSTITAASGTAVAATTAYTYDNAGQTIAIQDAVGNVTQADTWFSAVGRSSAPRQKHQKMPKTGLPRGHINVVDYAG